MFGSRQKNRPNAGTRSAGASARRTALLRRSFLPSAPLVHVVIPAEQEVVGAGAAAEDASAGPDRAVVAHGLAAEAAQGKGVPEVVPADGATVSGARHKRQYRLYNPRSSNAKAAV